MKNVKVPANNGYNHTEVTSSDKPGRVSNQKAAVIKETGTRTNHDARSPSEIKYPPMPNQKHEGFQFGTNPETESSFERDLIMAEKKERDMNREKYILGIQGTDGGKKPYETRNILN